MILDETSASLINVYFRRRLRISGEDLLNSFNAQWSMQYVFGKQLAVAITKCRTRTFPSIFYSKQTISIFLTKLDFDK